MDILPADIQVVRRVLTVENQIFFSQFDGPLNHIARHSQSSVIPHNGARPSAGFNAVWRGVAKTHFIENPENILPDSSNACIF